MEELAIAVGISTFIMGLFMGLLGALVISSGFPKISKNH